MVQNIPLSDTFDDYGGAFFTSYIRLVVSTTPALNLGGYAVTFGEGTLNSGYKASFGGVSMTSTSSPTVANTCCGTSWRGFSNLTQSCEAVFKLATTSGAATDDSFRQAYVMCRVQGGTFDDTAERERNSNVTGYMILMVNTLAQGMRFIGIRWNAGVPTVLGTLLPSALPNPLPNTALAFFGANGRRLRIAVIGLAGNPNVTAYIADADGSNEQVIGTFVDSSASKITTAGRCAFGMTTDRLEAGSTRTATLCTYFRVVNDGPPVEVLRDEWERNAYQGFGDFTLIKADLTDANGISGKRAQQLWVTDLYCANQAAIGSGGMAETDTGLNRLTLEETDTNGQKTFAFFSTWPPNCGKCFDMTYTVMFRNSLTSDPTTTLLEPRNELVVFNWSREDGTAGAFPAKYIQIGWGIFNPGEWGFRFNSPGRIYNEPNSSTLGMGINIPITIRVKVDVTGTAPNRVWTFHQIINGVQIPYVTPLVSPFVANGDGTFSLLESAGGSLPDNWMAGGGIRFRRYNLNLIATPDPEYDDYRIDTIQDGAPACCATAALPEPTQLVLSAPALAQLLVITPTVSSPPPTQLVLSAPAISVQRGDTTAKDPAGQIKTAGIAAGRISYAGIVAGRLMS